MDVAHVVARFVLQVMTESILRLDQLKMLSMWKASAHPRARVFFCLSVCVCVCLSLPIHLPGPVGAGVSARMYGCAAGWMMPCSSPNLLFSCGRLMLCVCVVSVCVCLCLCRPGHVAHDEGRGRPLSKKGNISHLAKRQASILGRMWSRRSSENECHGRNSQFSQTGQSDSATLSYRISVQQPWLLSFNRGPQTIAKGVSVRTSPASMQFDEKTACLLDFRLIPSLTLLGRKTATGVGNAKTA